MNAPKATPMIQQYLSIKEQYPDAILFYRMGDFYEMFFEDAKVAASALEITLTSRNKNENIPVPMCGVPYRAAQGYIVRLIEQGFKVAICDQIEDPAAAKGLVKRDVVRVITPGMIVDNSFLDAKSNNFILAVARLQAAFGVAYLDISTGTFRLFESNAADTIREEILRVAPSEILLAEEGRGDPEFSALTAALPEVAVSYVDGNAFDYRKARERLLAQFNTLSLEGFGCEDQKAAVSAAGAVLFYVRETQKQDVAHLARIETYSLDNHLIVDEISCRNLELLRNIRSGGRGGTLLNVIDKTVTPMGARALKNWLRYPLADAAAITARLDAVAEAKGDLSLRGHLREQFKSVFDLERLGSKIAMGQANARDLVALKTSLETLPAICAGVARFQSRLFQGFEDTRGLTALAALIARAIREDAPPTITEGGIIKTGFNSELDELIQISRDGKSWLARLESEEREATGISSLKVRYNKVFGYYIEVSKTHAAKVPVHYVRKQTLVNAERYVTEALKDFEARVLGAEDQRATLEYRLFNDLRTEVMGHRDALLAAAEHLARLDCLLALAEVADHSGYVRPEINAEGIIEITDGRHPVVEKMIAAERFVPNSIRLDDQQNQVLVITGPNMAGKSTILRQVALTVVLGQMGAFVPARRASLAVTDRIFTRVGALDNLSQGQSTFMVEMQETANILNNATPRSLVIMDEIGRGTSTFDGLSIAWAVAEHLHDAHGRGVKTLVAPHYHELTDLAQSKTRVKNFNIAVKEWNDEIIFLRKLVEGGTNRSYGIQVARLAGIPEPVIRRAKKILFKIENNEDSLYGRAMADHTGAAKPAGPVQLSLFQKPEQIIVDRLQALDIATMTPLEALNCLSELKDRAREALS